MTKAIILAAGLGTRLRPYTDNLPKALVSIGGKPLLQRQIEVLNFCGISEVVVVAGHKFEKFSQTGARVILNPNYERSNMLASLFTADSEFDGDVVVSYGDIVYSHLILRSLLESKEEIAVSVDLNWRQYWSQRMDRPELDAETLRLSSGRIVEIGSKPISLDEVQGQYMGLFKLSPKGWSIFREHYLALYSEGITSQTQRDEMSVTAFLQHLVSRNVVVMSVPSRYPWVEVDSTTDLHLVETHERLKAIEMELGFPRQVAWNT